MFTGIIESIGTVVSIEPVQDNLRFTLQCPFTHELKIDQSLAHNGVCLTVDGITDDRYTVTAIPETLQRTSLGELKPGDKVNLERCMRMDGRLDGHIVQGHVDTTGTVEQIRTHNGSWEFFFTYDAPHITVEKGSICVNGVSLTVVHSSPGRFSVAIIPYTYEHTNFHTFTQGSRVNLEFDIIGKYIARLLQSSHPA